MNNTNALNISRRPVSRTVQGIEQVVEFDTRLAGRISNRAATNSAKAIWNRNPFYSCATR